MARYSDVAGTNEAVLVETDDFALVFNRDTQKFYIKWWDSFQSYLSPCLTRRHTHKKQASYSLSILP